MFKIALTTVIALTAANAAMAAQPPHQDQRIAAFCGADHRNEITEPGDAMLGATGYVIKSLNVTLDPRDPRVIPGFVETAYLCTDVIAGWNDKAVKYLFVPSAEWGENFAAP